ncbi:hypothetical protein Goshw_002894 [Gossypium schwendimanii]|uniref:Zinc knuckle CX2CX4HX4C domain-containing protein n=1 Tax=Gossypium schwendimanii TaxID=34291 RepID=A0A7J9KVT8_GOSSC|nr:hypothetical protein [Gossypium schwendimanii]
MGDIHADQETSWTNSEASFYLSEDEELRGVDQIRGLPLEMLNPITAVTIARLAGEEMEVDWHAKFPMNIRFLRVRICIDPWRPLLVGYFVRVGEGRRIWIQFRYERVFRICKNCGRIMHTYPSCGVDNLDIERELNSQLDNIRHRFGYNIGMDVQEVHFVNEMCAFLHRSDRRATRVYYC